MLHLDDRIFRLQQQGGISLLWRKVAPHLQAANGGADVFLSTYYAPAPSGMASAVVVYDFIAERYPAIGAQHPDAVAKRQAIAQADTVIAISDWTAGDVQRFCGKPSAVAHCGTDYYRARPDEVEAFRARYGIARPYVLVVGRRRQYKNVQALYQAWQFFEARDDTMIVCTGGDAPDQADQQFARDYPGQWLHIRPADDEMPAAYTGAAMLVYPTLFEGFGLPVLEAMACGTPVVCGKRAALPEVAGDTAYYADVFRPARLADGMNAALKADVQRQQDAMARAQPFTWERMGKAIQHAIERRL